MRFNLPLPVVMFLLWFLVNPTSLSAGSSTEGADDTLAATALPGLATGNEVAFFSTIIIGADEEVGCANDGSTVAKFFLCGNSDVRTISLSQSGSSYSWEKLDENSCAPSVKEDCANTQGSCYQQVGTASTFNLDADGEYRVRVDGGTYYYFKASLNPLNPQLIKEDIICGSSGRVEITNVPSDYEYSLNDPNGPFQDQPYFDVATPGDYVVYARLKNVSGTTCVFPSNTVNVASLQMSSSVTAHDIQCSGEMGSIDVSVGGVPGFFTYRLMKNGVTVDTFGPVDATSYTFDNVSTGTYEVRVSTNKCNELLTQDVNGNAITIGNGISPLAVSATAEDSFGCGASNVPVSIGTNGGTAPYQFSLDGGATYSSTYNNQTNFTVNNPGTYDLLVRDANGCTKSASVSVEDLPPPEYNVTATDASCGSSDDGRIQVNVTNGNGYELAYSINNGGSYRSGNVFNDLAPGSYDVVIRYRQGGFECTTPAQQVNITAPDVIFGSASANSVPSCGDENGGSIQFSGISGGTAPYEFSVGAGFQSGNTFSNLGSGTYTPRIRDANGCVQTLNTITFDPLNKPNDLDFTISDINCTNDTASVTLSESGGTAPYTYEIIAPSAYVVNNGSNPVFTGLGLGSYTFRITDNEGCSYEESYAITDISSVSVQAQSTRSVTCFGANDGEGRFLIDGFESTYSYTIDGGSVNSGQTDGVISLNGLAAGSYQIEVTDEETNCTDTATLVIQEPAAAFAIDGLTVTAMNCQNNNTGGVTIETSGGWGGNRYTLTQPNGATRGPQNNRSFSNLTQSGTYQVSVTDANGCTVTDSFSLTALDAPVLSIDASASDYCYDNVDAATIALSSSGGTAPYQYRINGGAWGSADTYGGLTPGTYRLEIMDANNCQDLVWATIAPEISASASITRELTCGGPSAEIRVDLSGGYHNSGDYETYEVSINGGPFSADTNAISGNSFTYNIPNDGSITLDTTYQFEVTDSRGCATRTNAVTISPPETISGTVAVTDTSCGADNGTVELIPDSNFGVPPYQYSNDGGATFGGQAVFTGYAAGTYNDFMIRDSRGCRSPVLSATINPSAPIDAAVTANDATCSAGAVEGSIDVTGISNGDAMYTYELLDIDGNLIATAGPTAQDTTSFPGIPPGTYTVVTTDGNNCEDRDTITLTQNQLDLVPVSTTTPPDCSTTFTYIVDIVGGTGPYQIGLLGDPLGPPNVDLDTHDFTGDIEYGTSYMVQVEDALGCTYLEEIEPIQGPSPIEVNTTATTASCDVSGSGEIIFEVSGISGPADLIISLQDRNTGNIIDGPTTVNNVAIPYQGTFTNLAPGNYQVLIEDANTECNASALVAITQDIPAAIVEQVIAANCNAPAQVSLRGSGGTAPYEFNYVPTGDPAPSSFSGTSTFQVVGPYPGDYDFYVRDANGCISFTTVTVTEDPGVPEPIVDVANQCSAQSNYTVEVTYPLSSGSGLPDETFQYDIGGGFQDSPIFNVPNSGDYTITVRDGRGCINTTTARVFDFFAITANASTEPTCNAGDGIITVTTSGGSGNFQYELNDGINPTITQLNDNNFENISPGTYSITVTDLDSNTSPKCSDSTSVEVTIVDSPEISATPAGDLSCNGAVDGYINIELRPGTDTDAPFEYVLYQGSGNTVLAGPQASSLFDGLAAGTYQVEVISDRGCRDRSGDILIQEPSVLQLTTENTEFTCDPNSNRFSTATITLYTDSNGDGTGTDTGTGPYTYSMDDGTPEFDGANFQTSNQFEVVDNGSTQTITLTARDRNGCETSETITLSPPNGLNFSFDVSPLSCGADGSTTNPGTITVIIDEGAGDYEVEILPLGTEAPRSSNGSDRVTYDITTPGDYIFAVRDIGRGGCSYLTPVVNMPEFNNIDVTVAEVKPVTCYGGNDGAISIIVDGYQGIYNYEVFTRANDGTETSTGVTGSFDTENPIATPEIIEGLPAGNLVVAMEAQEFPYCDAISNTTTVRQPDSPLSITLDQTGEVTCSVPGKGEIFARGQGGWAAYQYRVIAPDTTIIQDFPSTNASFSDLSAGIYTVQVRDSLGCLSEDQIELTPPEPIQASVRITSPLLCNNDNNGGIEAFDIIGGQGSGNYLYRLNRINEGTQSGLQTTPQFENLSAGDYSITVLDGWECSFTTEIITIADPEVIIAELVELQPPGCGDVGIMELTVTNPEVGVSYFYRRAGSTDPFLPLDPLDPYATSVRLEADITVDPGPFQYEVQNSNGCPFERSNQISLDPAAPLVIGLDLTNATVNCAGEATGIIRAEAYGGIGNYVYTLLNSDTPPMPTSTNTFRPEQESGIFRELPAGTYWVYAQSGGCSAISEPITISEPPPLVLESLEVYPVSCHGDVDGEIVIEASGGSGRIRYAISENFSEFFTGEDPENPNRMSFSDLRPKRYEIIIQDDLGCTLIQEVEITEPESILVAIADSTPETCEGDLDGSVTLDVAGGTAPYEFAVNSSDPEDFRPNPEQRFDNLIGGETYVIFVRDAMGCLANVIVPVSKGEDLRPEAIVSYGCEGIFPNNTVSLEMLDDTPQDELLFALDPEDPTDAITAEAGTTTSWGNLNPGPHTVYVYHENGCATYVEFEIESFDPLTLEAVKTGPNEITAVATGGFGEYRYFFQGEAYGSTNVFTLNEDQEVRVRVVDDKGCEVEVLMNFDFTGTLDMPKHFSPNGDVMNEVWSPMNRELFPNLQVKIYDRYGRVVAILDNVTEWDGTYAGQPVPTGDYWYVVNANDKEHQQYVGHFTLYR